MPSTLTWRERKVVVQQMTDFPYADTTRLVVKGSGRFDMKVRVPRWATRGFFVKINGRDEAGEGDAGHLPDAVADLARQRHDRAADAVHASTSIT